MSDTDDSQIIEPILTPYTLPNHIPYILQRLKEIYDRIQSYETYVTLSSQEENVSTFKLAFQQALDTLQQHTLFVQARQEDWVHKFERMRQIASQWAQHEYYMDLIQKAEHAFMDVLEWIRTSEAESAEYARTYATLFNIDFNVG
jgi:hypothetical protein